MRQCDLRIRLSTLDSGLRLLCVEQPLLHGICISLHVNIGPRFETEDGNGCSHMLEHMLFRGTPHHPSAHALAVAVERLGGTLYGATHTDHGHMSVTLPPDNMAEGLALFGEILTRPLFTDIEVERGIIREEILEGLDEEGRPIDPDDLSRSLMYPSHPLGMPITGSLVSVDRIDVDALRAHHERFYTGSNSVLCIAGPVDPVECEELAAICCVGMPRGEPLEIEPPSPQTGYRFQYTENQGSQTDLRLAFRAPGRDDLQEPAADVLVRLLDDGMSTRLYAQVCDKKGLCYDVSAAYEPFGDDGVLDLAATVRHSRAPMVMRELCEIVGKLVREGPTEDELRICKNRHHWGLDSLLDDAEGLAGFHGLVHLTGHDPMLLSRREKIEAVSRDQVVELARRIFRVDQSSAVAVGMLRRAQRKEIEHALAALPSG